MLYVKAIVITLAVMGFFFALPLMVYAIPFGIIFLIVLAVLKEIKEKPSK